MKYFNYERLIKSIALMIYFVISNSSFATSDNNLVINDNVAVTETIVDENALLNSPVNSLLNNPLSSQPKNTLAANSPSSISYALPKVAAGLMAVLSLIFVLSYIAKRIGIVDGKKTRDIKLCESITIGSKERLVVIECDHEKLLLGVTAGSINVLKNMPLSTTATGASPGDPELAAKTPIDFQQKLNMFLLKGSK